MSDIQYGGQENNRAIREQEKNPAKVFTFREQRQRRADREIAFTDVITGKPKKLTPYMRRKRMEHLKGLEAAVKVVREELGFNNRPGEVISQWDTSDGLIVVVSDGYGKAVVSEVEGNYPVDYMTKRESALMRESAACRLAEKWADS